MTHREHGEGFEGNSDKSTALFEEVMPGMYKALHKACCHQRISVSCHKSHGGCHASSPTHFP
eukprot:2926254-Rhodomonas_salina.4